MKGIVGKTFNSLKVKTEDTAVTLAAMFSKNCYNRENVPVDVESVFTRLIESNDGRQRLG